MSNHSEPDPKPALKKLPAECWIIIFESLPAREAVRARRVSKDWLDVLTNREVCRRLLHRMFPLCRELRLNMLRYWVGDLPDMPHNLRVEVECRERQVKDWSEMFATVTRRYYHLQIGNPREYLKLPMPDMVDLTNLHDCTSGGSHGRGICSGCLRLHGDGVCPDCHYKIAVSSEHRFFWMNVPVWPRAFYGHDHSDEFHFSDPMWWYSQEDGLLVYPASWSLYKEGTAAVKWVGIEQEGGGSSFLQSYTPATGRCEDFFYRLFDPETGEHVRVPFDVRGKIIRRVRLAQGVLILEWVQVNEDKSIIDGTKIGKSRDYKAWNQSYRYNWTEYSVRKAHMVTVYDVVRTSLSHDKQVHEGRAWTWNISLRHEWKLPSWGSGPSVENLHWEIRDGRSRFFSTHTSTHYALFIWTTLEQPDGVHPYFRQLFVWDISAAERDSSPDSTSKKSRRRCPTFVVRLDEEHMRHYQDVVWDVQAELHPNVRNISMDEHNVYLVLDDHRWAVMNYHSSVAAHSLLSHAIPVIPFPHAKQNSRSGFRKQASHPVFGPQSIDKCPQGRYSGFGLARDSDDAFDPEGFHTSQFCRHFIHAHEGSERRRRGPATSYPPFSSLPKNLLPAATSPHYPWNGSDAASNPLQPRNFPGFPPCWRHENFPYVGISAVTDYAAGVRFVARDSRPLDKYTHLLKPTVTVNMSGSRRLIEHTVDGGDGGDDDEVGDNREGSKWITPRIRVLNPSEPPPTDLGPYTREELLDRYLAQQSDYLAAVDADDLDPLAAHLCHLRHPFKFFPEPRNIRQDEVEVRCPGFWENMMGRMTLAGDERWLIGQDAENRITLVRF